MRNPKAFLEVFPLKSLTADSNKNIAVGFKSMVDSLEPLKSLRKGGRLRNQFAIYMSGSVLKTGLKLQLRRAGGN